VDSEWWSVGPGYRANSGSSYGWCIDFGPTPGIGHRHIHADADLYLYPDSHPHADLDANCHGHAHPHPDADLYTDAQPDAHGSHTDACAASRPSVALFAFWARR
jgi:hypothetical protein